MPNFDPATVTLNQITKLNVAQLKALLKHHGQTQQHKGDITEGLRARATNVIKRHLDVQHSALTSTLTLASAASPLTPALASTALTSATSSVLPSALTSTLNLMHAHGTKRKRDTANQEALGSSSPSSLTTTTTSVSVHATAMHVMGKRKRDTAIQETSAHKKCSWLPKPGDDVHKMGLSLSQVKKAFAHYGMEWKKYSRLPAQLEQLQTCLDKHTNSHPPPSPPCDKLMKTSQGVGPQ